MSAAELLNSELTLAADIVELIQAKGPLNNDDIASRLSVASRHRFKGAVEHLLKTGRVEKLKGNKPGLRIVGDKRPIPLNSSYEIGRRRRRSVRVVR